MIFFLYGSDTFRSRQRLRFLREGFRKKYDPQGYNIEILAGGDLKIGDFRKKLESQGLLSNKRLIIIEEILKNKSKKIQEEVVNYLEENPLGKNDILIFWEGDLGKKRKKGKMVKEKKGRISEFLLKEAKTEEFVQLSSSGLNKWVLNEIKKRKARISKEALDLLVGLVGNDLWQMSNEIEKLTNYKEGKAITSEDISQFVKAKYDMDIFRLSDALAEKKLKKALKLIHDQLSSGENELYLLSMLTRQYRILLQVKETARDEANYFTIASRLGLNPFVAKKALSQIDNYSSGELKNIYQKLLNIDIKIKTSQSEPKLLFDLFILETCG